MKEVCKILLAFGILILLALALPLINAESIGTFKQNECLQLIQTCGDCTWVNISSVINPNSVKVLGEKAMQKTGTFYNYTFCDTSVLGTYNVNGHGNEYGLDTVWAYDFEVTPNGKAVPSGSIVVLFSVFFVVLVGLSGYFVLYTLGHFVKMDFDIIDLAIDFGIFFMILASYYLENYYLANPFIDSLHIFILSFAGILFLLVPLIAFILSIAIGALNPNKRMKIAVPTKIQRRWRL